jgi:hypothetical protein
LTMLLAILRPNSMCITVMLESPLQVTINWHCLFVSRCWWNGLMLIGVFFASSCQLVQVVLVWTLLVQTLWYFMTVIGIPQWMRRLKIVVIELVRPGMYIYIGECDIEISLLLVVLLWTVT